MIVLAFDPGVTTGVAAIESDFFRGYGLLPVHDWPVLGQIEDPVEIAGVIKSFRKQIPVVVVEAFPGGGFKTKEGVQTIKVFGFVEFYAKSLGLIVEVQQPQARKPYLEEARRLVHRPKMQHATDALAHALSFAASLRRPQS